MSYPHLFQFFGCYFHQDWRLEFVSPENAVSAFIAENPRETVQSVVRELEALLALNDEALTAFYDHHAESVFNPATEGKTLRQWIQELRDRLATV